MRRASRNASTSAASRSTGWTPPVRAIQPTTGQSNSSFLPSQWIRRPSVGVSHAPSTTGSKFEAWLDGDDHRAVARDLVDGPLDPDPRHGAGEDPGAERHGPDERRRRALDGLGGGRAVRGGLGTSGRHLVGHRRASTSRIALVTASTVSSKRLPSVTMIRASSPAAAAPPRRFRSSSSRRRRAARMSSASGPSGSRPRSSVRRRGPLLDRRVEEDLEVGVGQDDGPDVAAGHDDPAGPRPCPAGARAARSGAPGRPRRSTRRNRPPGRARRRCDRSPSTRTRDKPALLVRREFHLVDERAQGHRVVDLDAAMLGQPGHRPVQQARVAEAVADVRAPPRPRRCSCPTTPARRGRRRARAVLRRFVHPRQDSR